MKKFFVLCSLAFFAVAPLWAASNQTGEYKNGFNGNLVFDDETDDQVDTASNELIISGGAFNGDIITGQSETGSALENELRLVGGTITSPNLKAGVSKEQDASDNTVLMQNVTVQGNVTGGEAAGTDSGDATGNQVIMQNATVNYNAASPNKVVAGQSQAGTVSNNDIHLEDASVLGTTAAAGYSAGTGEVFNNTLWVYDGSNITDASGSGAAYGGYSAEGSVYNNQITVYDAGTIDADLYGGYAGKAAALRNLVIVNKGTVNANVYGGYSAAEGAASQNELRLNGGTFAGTLAGGWANGSGNANNNKVTIGSDTTLNATVSYGGYSAGADAQNNTLSLSSLMTGDKAYGGYAAKGNAGGNRLDVGIATQGGSLLAGGWANAGAAEKNTLAIDTASFTVTGGLYGGYGASLASGNTLGISLSSLGGTFYGGYAQNGAASGNTVFAEISTLNGNIYGGYTEKTEASGNTVQLNDVTVNGDVYGGYAAGTDTVTNNNTVILSGKTVVNGNFYGGNGTTAQGNALVLENYEGTINAVNAFDRVTLSGLNSLVTFTQDVDNVGVVLYGRPSEVAQTVAYTPANSSLSLNRDVLGAYAYSIESVNQSGQLAWNVKGQYQNDLAKPYAQAQLAYLTLAGQGDEMLSAVFDQALNLEETDDTFAQVQYYDNTYETGSSFDMQSFAVQAGRWFKAGDNAWGLFAQYGHGQYSVDPMDGEGAADAFALGGFLLLPYSDMGRFEATARVGYQQGDFSSEESFSNLDQGGFYGGASAGLTQNIAALQIYGKINWLYLAGDDITDNLGQQIAFNDTQSLNGRFGARLDLGTWWKRYQPYIGVGGIYEFDADSDVSVDGHRVTGAELGGLTGQAEIGLTYQNDEAMMPMKSSLSVFGLTGQAEGWGANIRLAFSF